MKLTEYLADRVLLLVLHLFCMLLLSGFLYATGSPLLHLGMILIFWCLILLIYFSVQYWNRRIYFQKAESLLHNLDQRYLLGEMLPESFHLEDRLYRDMIRRSNKSVIERIHLLEEEQKDYQEYIESWVHEIKAPVTSIGLFCENNKNEVTRKILLENQRTENYIDMVLYYARSENVYKDYLIKETDLNQIAAETIVRNKQYLIQNHVKVEVNCPPPCIYRWKMAQFYSEPAFAE